MPKRISPSLLMPLPHFQIQTPSLAFQSETTGSLSLVDIQTGWRVLHIPTAYLFVPVIDGQRAELTFSHGQVISATRVDLHFTGEQFESFFLRIEGRPGDDAIAISCAFKLNRGSQLNQIDFFPRETILDFYHIVNYRNRHGTEATWPELLPATSEGCKTDTYSTDWQFAPHPTLLIFQKHELQLLFGAFDLPRAFGMYLEAADRKVRSWYLDYGQSPHGQPLAAGEQFTSPAFLLFIRRDLTVEGILDTYARMLIDARKIPDPAKKVRHAWWREPLYCTWIDKCLLSQAVVPIDLKEQAEQAAAATADPAGHALQESMVRRAVEVIEREKLPFRTILLDGGWSIATGQWEPDPHRLPHLRKLVDELHGKGFKIVVWWNWAEVSKSAQVNPAELIGGGKLNRHDARVRDYSLPSTQDYLRRLFHQLFSSDPGCYDLDGVKTDFLADKVHPDMPPGDPSWRGEENYFLQVSRLFYQEMKRHKPDAIHIGCAGNFWLAEYIDINRTYDAGGTNHLQHETRGRMLRHTTPGTPVAYDFHNHLENLNKYFASAHRNAASVQIGNILMVQENMLSSGEPPSPDYFAMLRRELPFQQIKRI